MTTDTASQTPEGLLQAFAQTDYHVHVDSCDGVVRVGENHAWLDRALDGRGWAILTACNPRGERHDDAFNRRQHQRLEAEIARRSLPSWPTVARDPGGAWPDEPGLLVTGLSADDRTRLADAFDQAAFVIGRKGAPASLELFGDPWPASLPDWAARRR